ncbi:tRNA (adenosine(37)-N6)-dimethylallyltransferase MiaA [Candidatus Gracilibacteria bacterium]|nr:tRNA (adenosine(37)-N6)-dimethylallyltransferase MiaA [Candidatus Gracilibacteria bacterium]
MGTTRQASLVNQAKPHIDQFFGQHPHGVVVIVGPTASGKTSLSLALAQHYGGEIVSADSRLLYRELNIGTAKPSGQELASVPHHLVDIIDANQEFSVAEYQKRAYVEIDNLLARKQRAFLVGGTMLYIDAVVYNFLLPVVDGLEETAAHWRQQDLPTLQKLLLELRPDAGEFIDIQNPVRLQRVMTHYQLHHTWLWEENRKGEPQYPALILGLKIEKELLRERITSRVDQQFADGLVSEVTKLVARYGIDAPGLRTIGYTQVLGMLAGLDSKAQAKEKVIHATLDYAKRQMTWWKRNKDIVWIDAN